MDFRDPSQCAPLLLPTPKHMELLAGEPLLIPKLTTISGVDGDLAATTIGTVLRWVPATSAHLAWLSAQVDSALGAREHYVLTILHRHGQQPQVQINASDREGLRHGLYTLAQLIRQYRNALPCMRIEDRPAFAHRGVMLDISRDRVPTMEELKRTVALLASLKINHLQLYTEHTFAYRGHEAVWKHASPLDAREVRDLDRHCTDHGIRLVANQNCFGHMERWLRHDAYRHLAEAEEWTAFGQTRRYPFTLAPEDPGSIALVRDLLSQLLPHFSTKMVNVGCDETFDLGQGRSRAACEARGKSAVYLDFVKQVCGVAREQGYQPLMWADIALEHPEALAELPENVIALVWNYEGNASFGQWCDQLRSVHREAWVCPGTSSWCSLVGRTQVRHDNCLAAAVQGLVHGATGYLLTDWGDLGHRQPYPISAIGWAEGALRAWSGDAPWDARTASLHVFADRSLTVGPWLDAIGDVDADLRLLGGRDAEDGTRLPLMNRSALFHDLHLPVKQPWVGDFAQWEAVNEAISALPPPDPLISGIDPLLAKECRHAWRSASIAASRAVCRRSQETKIAYAHLAEEIGHLCDEHRELWHHRSRPGGLDDSAAHYQRIIDDMMGAV